MVQRRSSNGGPGDYGVSDMPRDTMLSRPLPHSADAERAILGAVVLDNSLALQAAALLTRDDFYVRAHNFAFAAMMALYERGSEINPILLGEELKREGQLEQAGGVSFLSELTYGLPHFTNVAAYAKVVKDHSVLRQAIKVANKITSAALDGEDDAETVVAEAETMILGLVNEMYRGHGGRNREGFYTLKELVGPMRDRLEAFHKHQTKAITTGMREVDDMLDGGGLQAQGLYYVGAAPKSGKTSLALGWAYHVARVLGRRVLAVSEEMHRLQLMQRLYSAHIGVPYFMFRPGFYGKEYELALERLADFGDIPISISDNLYTVPQIRRHCRREVQGAKPGEEVGLIIIDYLQLVALSDEGLDWRQRAQVVGQVSREMKRMAQELDVPVLAMSALNRDSSREGRRPELHDLRESGQLEFDAEGVFFLWNPAYVPGQAYQRKDEEDITLIIGAQRNGPTGDIPVKFLGKYMQFLTEADYRAITEGGYETAQQKTDEEDTRTLWDEKTDEKKKK
jgi:replicative DNA helicase